MFPGAQADPEQSQFGILGAPLDISTTFHPGARFGPERIRRFARSFEDFHHASGVCFSDCAVSDHGNLDAWDDPSEYLDFLEGMLTDILEAGATPVLLGGEHTVSVAGIRALEPDTVVVLDAHLDLRTEFDGNAYSHATVGHHALDVADQLVVLGGRSGSEVGWERAESEAAVTVVAPEDVLEWEPSADLGSVYCSVDIDVADPAFAPGTGTPEPGGLSSRECQELVARIAPHADAFDVVEVNDRDDGQAALLAGSLLREFVCEKTRAES